LIKLGKETRIKNVNKTNVNTKRTDQGAFLYRKECV